MESTSEKGLKAMNKTTYDRGLEQGLEQGEVRGVQRALLRAGRSKFDEPSARSLLESVKSRM
jgi:hypothetical protein